VVVYFESEALDSQTGDQLGAMVCADTGKPLKGASDKLSLANVQPALDHWADIAATQVRALIPPTAGAH
jgi:hypothetical protein